MKLEDFVQNKQAVMAFLKTSAAYNNPRYAPYRDAALVRYPELIFQIEARLPAVFETFRQAVSTKSSRKQRKQYDDSGSESSVSESESSSSEGSESESMSDDSASDSYEDEMPLRRPMKLKPRMGKLRL
jgi:hypothetical protein